MPTVFNLAAIAFLTRALLGLLPALPLEWPELSVCLAGAGLCAVLGNPHAIESLKLPGGFEAKTREVVRRAEATLSELQRMTEILGGVLVEQIAGTGRWGGSDTPEKDEARKQRVLEMMRAVGLSQAAIDRVSAADRQWVVIDYVAQVLRETTVPPERLQEWNGVWEPYHESFARPDPKTLEDILSRFGVTLSDSRREWLEDYRHYYEHSKHRRSEAWTKRQ